ncbi:MAG TPA: hypothetical protein VHR41_16540 [Gemmatimonadales bacterium]|nr:hypothetical protein [Gemmatimonadales bacterium]
MPHTSRSASPLALLLAVVLLALAAGCGEDTESPTAPESRPALATAAQPLSFRQVSAGGGHACGVTTDDRAYCWGLNEWGELGDGDTDPWNGEICNTYPCSSRPVAVAGVLRFNHVSAGDRHTCGITTDNKAYCWGRNFEGQLGTGAPSSSSVVPVAVAGTRLFRQVRAADNHTCAITKADVAFCWGYNGDGELGDGTTDSHPVPVRVAGGLHWSLVSGGFSHTCGVTTDNHAYCWGTSSLGALGSVGAVRRLSPFPVSGGLLFSKIDAGHWHSCGVTTDNRAYCWGLNSVGELGDGTKTNRQTPTLVFGNRRYDHVIAGDSYTCGVTLAERGFCWGVNSIGQLGTGTTDWRRVPTAVAGGLSLHLVTAGAGFACGVTTANRAYCWGDDAFGQGGDGTTNSGHLAPVAVAGPI